MKLLKWGMCSLLLCWGADLFGGIADELAKTTINVALIKNESDFLVVVQQTEGHKYADGTLRPRRTVKEFNQGNAETKLADFTGFNLVNTPFALLPDSELKFSTDPLSPERFPVPRDIDGMLSIVVFGKGWQPDGFGVYVCELRSHEKSIKILEVKQSILRNTKVVSLRNSFRRTERDNYIMFDRNSGKALSASGSDKQKEAEYFFTQSEALFISIKKNAAGQPIVELTMKNV